MAPADLQWSLFGAPEQFEDNATQSCYWELQKFLIMALKANPNILECLYSPMVDKIAPLGEELLDRNYPAHSPGWRYSHPGRGIDPAFLCDHPEFSLRSWRVSSFVSRSSMKSRVSVSLYACCASICRPTACSTARAA